MQLLGLITGQILGSLAILIFFGIIMEKRYVSWWSVGGNIVGLILTFTTLDLNPIIIVVMSAYAITGFVCAYKRWSKVYVFFGSKTYGSALLVLGLFSIEGAYAWLNNVIVSLSGIFIPEIAVFMIFWVAIALIIFAIGYYVRKRIDNRTHR